MATFTIQTNNMLYTFKAEDFKGDYRDITDCACARLVKRTHGVKDIMASPDDIRSYEEKKYGVIGDVMLNGELLSNNWFSQRNFEEIQAELGSNTEAVATIEIEWSALED